MPENISDDDDADDYQSDHDARTEAHGVEGLLTLSALRIKLVNDLLRDESRIIEAAIRTEVQRASGADTALGAFYEQTRSTLCAELSVFAVLKPALLASGA